MCLVHTVCFLPPIPHWNTAQSEQCTEPISQPGWGAKPEGSVCSNRGESPRDSQGKPCHRWSGLSGRSDVSCTVTVGTVQQWETWMLAFSPQPVARLLTILSEAIFSWPQPSPLSDHPGCSCLCPLCLWDGGVDGSAGLWHLFQALVNSLLPCRCTSVLWPPFQGCSGFAHTWSQYLLVFMVRWLAMELGSICWTHYRRYCLGTAFGRTQTIWAISLK